MPIEVVNAEALNIEGLLTVDLIDADSGRVVQREESHNFISTQALLAAKWFQASMWMWYHPLFTNDALGLSPLCMPWFPAQHVAYWNDASAEDPSNEDRIRKEIVGWASRYPVGSPAGKRGVVNITESLCSATSAKWVFDWGTSQGNGTFQSVGWTRIAEQMGFPIGRFPEAGYPVFTGTGPSASGVNLGQPIFWDASTSLWNVIEYAGSQVFRVATAPAAGGAVSTVVNLPTWNGNQNAPGGTLYGLARIGTDIVTCGLTQSPQPNQQSRLCRHTIAGAQVFNLQGSITGCHYADCTVDGSGVIWTAGSDGIMRSHNPTTGAITASITPAMASVGSLSLNLIAYDSTDGNFWIGTLGPGTAFWKMDATGATIGDLLAFSGTNNVAATAPYAGNYNVPSAAPRDPYVLFPFGQNTVPSVAPSTSASGWASGYAGAVKDGLLYLSGRSAGFDNLTARASPLRGGNLATRTRLSSPIVKANTQTLKVTYQFNF